MTLPAESAHNWPRKEKPDRRRLPVAAACTEEGEGGRKSSRSIARPTEPHMVHLDPLNMEQAGCLKQSPDIVMIVNDATMRNGSTNSAYSGDFLPSTKKGFKR